MCLSLIKFKRDKIVTYVYFSQTDDKYAELSATLIIARINIFPIYHIPLKNYEDKIVGEIEGAGGWLS